MGNHQSGDAVPAPEALPRLLGRTQPPEPAPSKPVIEPHEVEADDSDLGDGHVISIPQLLTKMCSSLVAGFAGAHLWNGASTSNSRSTAGFLFLTWLCGLYQTLQESLLKGAVVHNTTVVPIFLAILQLLYGPLQAVQVVSILYLPLQRLESLQATAGRDLIDVSKLKRRVFIFGAVYVPVNGLISIAIYLSFKEMLFITQIVGAVTWICIIWFYCKILSACREVYSRLDQNRQMVELSGGTSKCQAAFRTAQKAILTESWGLRIMFLATVLVGRPVSVFIQLLSAEQAFIVNTILLLCNTAGGSILSNAHGLGDLQSCVITFLMAILVGLVLAGAKISGWKLALSVACTGLAAWILGLVTGDHFKDGELEVKLAKLCCIDGSAKEAMELEWRKKVTDLSRRGITARSLLNFYKKLGKDLMPHYVPSVHTTNDVVRRAIIPATKQQSCAYSLMAENGPVKPDRMVTHSWQNKFRDLVAAVIADAVHESSFDLVAKVLENDVSVLEDMLENQGTGNRAYWICAFSVNQHAGICGGNPNGDCDSLTLKVHETCDCGLPKMFNGTPPLSGDGNSIGCEMNKFDDMMALLAAGNPDFAQVVAVDQEFGLFKRAWCVAELVKADETKLKQYVLMHSRPLLARKKGSLKNLKVEQMQASRPEDVDYILSRIPNKNRFNQKLQHLIFDKAGLLSTWFQLDAALQMEEVGNLLKWSLADDGRGEIWQFWSKWGRCEAEAPKV